MTGIGALHGGTTYLVGQRMDHGDPLPETQHSDAPLTQCFVSSERDRILNVK